MKKWLHTLIYRLRQVHQQLGFVAPLSVEERAEVARWLPASALPLFQTMTAADQQHALRVCRGLQAHGCTDKDLLAAALLHDVGKAQGRVPFWTRPVIVIGKRCAPRLLSRLVFYPGVVGSLPDTFLLKDSRPKGSSQIHMCHGQLAAPPPTAHGTQKRRSVRLRADEGDGIQRVSGRETGWRRSLSYAWWHADIGADLAAAAGLSERAVLYIRTHHQPNGPAAELHTIDKVS